MFAEDGAVEGGSHDHNDSVCKIEGNTEGIVADENDADFAGRFLVSVDESVSLDSAYDFGRLMDDALPGG